MRRILIALATAATVCLAFNVSTAKEKPPEVTLELKGGSVAAGIGVSWESGTLTYNGKKYPVSLTGLDVVDVGVTRVTTVGKVYGLKKVEDFDGNYAAVGAGAALGGGGSTVTMQNQNGVRVDMVSTAQGIKLALAAGGVNMKIEK